jgi:hypothetical protein
MKKKMTRPMRNLMGLLAVCNADSPVLKVVYRKEEKGVR